MTSTQPHGGRWLEAKLAPRRAGEADERARQLAAGACARSEAD
jgi:hypothetical protein